MVQISITLLLTAALAATALSQAPLSQIEKVAQPPALKALPLSTPGRVAISGGTKNEYVSQWPGVYYRARFKGTALFFTIGTAKENLHLVIDRQPPLILADPKPGIYRVAGLADSIHTVTLLIASESQYAPNRFGGFAIPTGEQELPPPARRPHQIEFIGDSHTVGYGNTSPKRDCTPEEALATTDNTQAFGPLTAAHFDADYQINASSGRGIVRNYNGYAADTVPASYPFVLFDKQQPYSDPAWRPQWIVISLGTNDFSTPLNSGEKWKSRDELHADYEATYLRFLSDLRARNPSAYIILWATDLSEGEIASEVQRVVDRRKASGDRNIDFIPVNHLAFTGCSYHPSVADDQTISNSLVKFIESHPAIWNSK